MAEQRWADNQADNRQLTTAVTRGITFTFTTHLATVVTGISLWFLYFYGTLTEFWVIAPLVAISYGAQWLNHNSSLVKDDAGYLAAVAKVRRTMLVWTAALLIQIAVYLIINGVPDWNAIIELFVVE